VSLTPEQTAVLLRPIKPSRVLTAQNQSHVPAYDVAAHLTRIFGFGGWDKRILTLNLVSEEPTKTSTNREAWLVTYSCTMRLTVKDSAGAEVASWDDGACGTSTLPQKGEAHDMALKSAISYALKRCAAFGLGDQFGLSLYNKGSVAPLIGKTLVGGGQTGGATPDLESHVEVPRSMGNDERQDSEEPAAAPPAAAADTVRPRPRRPPVPVPDTTDDERPF
jgi:hypothetical protein